jgi:hypothetical protein
MDRNSSSPLPGSLPSRMLDIYTSVIARMFCCIDDSQIWDVNFVEARPLARGRKSFICFVEIAFPDLRLSPAMPPPFYSVIPSSISRKHSIDLKANGEVSRMRSHKGNMPSLPQTKHCSLCPAKFTRTTHLNRHLRSRGSSPYNLCGSLKV